MSSKELLVLVVEDNHLNRKLVRSVLELEGIRVVDAEDAEQGIDACRRLQPDLVLMDVQLPGMDGLEATRIIKSDRTVASIPVVALTSHAMEGDEEDARRAGCDGYIAKPIETDTFVNTVLGFVGHGPCSTSASDCAAQTPEEGSGASKVTHSPATILIVDDDPMNVKLFATFLEMEGYAVLTAQDGYAALDMAEEHGPDVILLDMMLPGMNGSEVARRLKGSPRTARSSILIISALHNIKEMVRSLGMGPEHVLKKPFKFEELINKVNSLLDEDNQAL